MDALSQIRATAERVVGAHGLELFDVQLTRESVGWVVRVTIDRPGPAATPEESVGIEDCSLVSRELSTILDVEDPLDPGVHAGSHLAGARSPAPARSRLPAIRGPPGQARARAAGRRPDVFQRPHPGRRGRRGRAPRRQERSERTESRSTASSAPTSTWNSRLASQAARQHDEPSAATDRDDRQGKGHRADGHHLGDRRRRADRVAQGLQVDREPEGPLQPRVGAGRPLRGQADRRRP